ncbi:hypothetical protein HDV00_000907 [Rhizophlyctis rosea]|nr:hypothetical protein HDV00_000907 [Rhizophlyctis rosea]
MSVMGSTPEVHYPSNHRPGSRRTSFRVLSSKEEDALEDGDGTDAPPPMSLIPKVVDMFHPNHHDTEKGRLHQKSLLSSLGGNRTAGRELTPEHGLATVLYTEKRQWMLIWLILSIGSLVLIYAPISWPFAISGFDAVCKLWLELTIITAVANLHEISDVGVIDFSRRQLSAGRGSLLIPMLMKRSWLGRHSATLNLHHTSSVRRQYGRWFLLGACVTALHLLSILGSLGVHLSAGTERTEATCLVTTISESYRAPAVAIGYMYASGAAEHISDKAFGISGKNGSRSYWFVPTSTQLWGVAGSFDVLARTSVSKMEAQCWCMNGAQSAWDTHAAEWAAGGGTPVPDATKPNVNTTSFGGFNVATKVMWTGDSVIILQAFYDGEICGGGMMRLGCILESKTCQAEIKIQLTAAYAGSPPIQTYVYSIGPCLEAETVMPAATSIMGTWYADMNGTRPLQRTLASVVPPLMSHMSSGEGSIGLLQASSGVAWMNTLMLQKVVELASGSSQKPCSYFIEQSSSVISADVSLKIVITTLFALGCAGWVIVWSCAIWGDRNPSNCGPVVRMHFDPETCIQMCTQSVAVSAAMQQACNATTTDLMMALDKVVAVGEDPGTQELEVGHITIGKPTRVRALTFGRAYAGMGFDSGRPAS